MLCMKLAGLIDINLLSVVVGLELSPDVTCRRKKVSYL